jgi:hypothetical protein
MYSTRNVKSKLGYSQGSRLHSSAKRIDESVNKTNEK